MKKVWFIGMLLVSAFGCGVNPAERNDAGNALYNQGQYGNAITAYQAAQVAAYDSPEAYYNAASAYSQIGEYDKAIAALNQALKTANLDLKMRTYFNLGNVYFQMRQFDDAIEAYQQVLLLNPDDSDARHNLELAIKHLVVPTPTPTLSIEETTDEGASDITPTSDLSSQPTANASSTSEIPTVEATNSTPSPNNADLPATISPDDAEHILDSVQQSQPSFPSPVMSETASPANSGKDW